MRLAEAAEERAEAAARRVHVEIADGPFAGEGERVHDAGRDLHPGPGACVDLAPVHGEGELAFEHVERLDVLPVGVSRRWGSARLASDLGDPDLLDVGEQIDVLDDRLGASDHRIRRRPPAVVRRRVLVVADRRSIADRAQVVGEASSRRVEVEVTHFGGARVAKAVDDERRHPRERPGGHGRGLPLGAEPHGELALEHVEHVRVLPVDVEVGAVATGGETRPRRVQGLVVGEDLDPPVGGVADDLAARGRNQDSVAHECPSMPLLLS